MYFYDRKIKDVHSWLQKIGLCRMKSFFFTSFLPSICASSTSSSSTSTIDILEFCRSTSGPPLQKNQAFKSDHLASSDFVKITSSAHTEHFLSHGSQAKTRIKTKAKTTIRHRKRQKTKTSFPRFTDSPEPGGKGRGKRGRSSMAAPSEVLN